MPKAVNLEIVADSGPRKIVVKINGEVVPVRAINIDFEHSQYAMASIELPIKRSEIRDEAVLLSLAPTTVYLLKEMGWTPPEKVDYANL